MDGLAGSHDVGDLRARIEGLAGELTALREHLESLARRGDVDALQERMAALAGRDELAGLAGRDEVEELRDRLAGVAARDDVGELRDRLDGLPGRDEVAELRARLEGLAGRDELSVLSERLDALGERAGLARQALATAQDALQRVGEVDRGAGSVLADVRALRGLVDEAASLARGAQEAGRADGEELREQVARLGGELEVARGHAGRAEAESLGALQAAAAAGESAGAARADAAEARATGQGLATRLSAVDQRAAALRAELGAGRERLDAVGAQVEQLGTTVLGTGDAVDAASRAGEERADVLRAELGQVREVAEAAARGIDALRAELAGVRAAADAVRDDAAAARAAANYGDERIVAMQSELTFALRNFEELKQGLSSAGQAAVIARREAEQARKAAQHAGDGSTERVTEVFQQILGLAAARNAPHGGHGTPSIPATPKPEPVRREPRHGFDDAAVPMAILRLDGKFKELNPAFAKLVGYQEHEFTKAAWPSPHDRRDYKDQLEQLRRLGVGELTAVEAPSTYMHGQGLMVPVVGRLSLVAARTACRCTSCSRPRTAHWTVWGGSLGCAPVAHPGAAAGSARWPGQQSGRPTCSASARTNHAQLKTAPAPQLSALLAAPAARCRPMRSRTPCVRRTSSRARRRVQTTTSRRAPSAAEPPDAARVEPAGAAPRSRSAAARPAAGRGPCRAAARSGRAAGAAAPAPPSGRARAADGYRCPSGPAAGASAATAVESAAADDALRLRSVAAAPRRRATRSAPPAEPPDEIVAAAEAPRDDVAPPHADTPARRDVAFHEPQPTVEYTPFQTDEHRVAQREPHDEAPLGRPRDDEPPLVAARGAAREDHAYAAARGDTVEQAVDDGTGETPAPETGDHQPYEEVEARPPVPAAARAAPLRGRAAQAPRPGRPAPPAACIPRQPSHRRRPLGPPLRRSRRAGRPGRPPLRRQRDVPAVPRRRQRQRRGRHPARAPTPGRSASCSQPRA